MKPGILDVGPDHLSWIENDEEPTSIDEGLPDAHLFVVRVADEHFADIIQFMSTGTTHEGYTTQHKKELVVRAVDFSVIAGHLYEMGSDKFLRMYDLDYE